MADTQIYDYVKGKKTDSRISIFGESSACIETVFLHKKKKNCVNILKYDVAC